MEMFNGATKQLTHNDVMAIIKSVNISDGIACFHNKDIQAVIAGDFVIGWLTEDRIGAMYKGVMKQNGDIQTLKDITSYFLLSENKSESKSPYLNWDGTYGNILDDTELTLKQKLGSFKFWCRNHLYHHS